MPYIQCSQKDEVEVTVFIPTYNGAKYIGQLLDSVLKQEMESNFDVLIIDSGSTDETLGIVNSFPGVTLVHIAKTDFGHGKTRNYAAELARGKYIAYLSHDAVPANSRWLQELIRPLQEIGPRVGGVLGKHIPRTDCNPLTRFGIKGVFESCGPDYEWTVIDPQQMDVNSFSESQLFYSDVNSATRRSFLTQQIPYRDVSYSEDIAFAEDFLRAGFVKVYTPFAAVVHSNDVSYKEFGKRIFDEYLGLRKISMGPQNYSFFGAIIRAFRDWAKFSVLTLAEKDYNLKQTLKWLFVLPLYAISKWLNIYRSQRVELTDTVRISQWSLEENNRSI